LTLLQRAFRAIGHLHPCPFCALRALADIGQRRFRRDIAFGGSAGAVKFRVIGHRSPPEREKDDGDPQDRRRFRRMISLRVAD
jgi:hypothetical protein